jgi:hypothetical protein
MSSPTPPPVQIQFRVNAVCLTCGKELYAVTVLSEEDFKEAYVQCLTASELHDCKGSAKGP